MNAKETPLHETKMTPKFTTIGHSTAFNNEQSQSLTVSYKRPRNEKVLYEC